MSVDLGAWTSRDHGPDEGLLVYVASTGSLEPQPLTSQIIPRTAAATEASRSLEKLREASRSLERLLEASRGFCGGRGSRDYMGG